MLSGFNTILQEEMMYLGAARRKYIVHLILKNLVLSRFLALEDLSFAS